MMAPRSRAAVLLMAGAIVVQPVLATVHHLVSANRYTPPKIHSIEFDDETNELTLVKTIEGNNSHIWISFSVGLKSLAY